MRNVFCVSYDLKADHADYSGFYEVLKASKRWWHYLESTWIVVVDVDADELWSKLEPHVKKGDRVLIIGVTDESQGILPTKAWEWIGRNIDAVTSRAD
jgi:hypothetical protein